MICEVNACHKNIKEGRFVCSPAMQRTPTGNRKVNLFMVVCLDCIETKGLHSDVSGHIKLVEEV